MDIHPPIFGLPFVVCGSTNPVFSANIGYRHPGLTFFEDLDDLAFAVPALFHVWLLFSQLCLLISGTILREPYPYSTQGYAKTVHCVHCVHGVSLKLHQIAPKISNRKGDSGCINIYQKMLVKVLKP